ncbi:MAG: bifunctional UDP-N-acetylmuramoyl-tripeptide:D-alanyl-D-alanine ligase/alanine racemase [Bacteroidota bacterium]
MGNDAGDQMITNQLAEIVAGHWLAQDVDRPIGQLITDTRNITNSADAVFFAITGSNHDGHDYLGAAYQAGIRTFVVERDVNIDEWPGTNILRTSSSVAALQQITKHQRGKFDIPVIGITGSNAKTIIKEWLSAILQTLHHVVKSPKSYNSQIGVPLSVWQMNGTHQIAVFEAGISQPGEMSRLGNVIQPTIGLFTNLGSAHDAGFESRQQKLKEKLLLFESAKTIVFCADQAIVNEEIRSIYSNKNLISWTLEDQFAEIQISKKGGLLTFTGILDEFDINIPFTDSSSVENLIHVIVLLRLLDISVAQIQKEISSLKQVKMRLELKEGLNRTYIIDDTYNNDLSGLKVALEFLNHQKQYEMKTLILAPIEQASQSDDFVYQEVVSLIKAFAIDRVIGIGEPLEQHLVVKGVEAQFYPNLSSYFDQPPVYEQEVILVKGARKYHLEQIVSSLQSKRHETVIEINLEALVHNLNIYRSRLKSKTKLMVMIKAMAYGSGIREIAQVLQHQKINYLGVAFVDEGVQLRKAGINLPIMVLNSSPDQLALLSEHDLQPEIYSLDQLKGFIENSSDTLILPPVHIKLETGMNRLGIISSDWDALGILLSENKVTVAGIMTHLAGADDPAHDQYSHEQIELFIKGSSLISKSIGQQPIRHVLNSPGILRFPEYHFDMVRLGIGIYGYDAANELSEQIRTVGTLRTYISRITSVKKGESVGYGRSWLAKRPTKVATLPIGYADGYRRSFSNGVAKVLVRDGLAPIVGSVCMDMCMIDVTDIDCHEGDEVVLFGERPTIQDLADWANTIPYEILTNVSDRVRRTFVTE